MPEAWIREVMRQESGGRATATSPVGAMGLMQVMPGTYRELQARHGLGDDPYHPYDSLMAGTAYIRQMYDLYGSPAFLVAYNAGPRRLENYLYNNGGMPNETRNYVARVGPGVLRASPVRRAPAEVYAAAEIPLSVPPGPRRMDGNTRMAIADARAMREQNAQYASTPPAEAPTRLASAAPQSFAPPAFAPVPYAAPSRGRGGVVAMEPIPDGSTPEGAMAMAASAARQNAETSPGASLAAAGGGQILPNGSILMARMDPIPDGSTPEGAARMAEFAARSEPAPRPEARFEAGSFARAVPLPPPAPASAPFARAFAAQAAQPAPSRGFGLISSAQAGTLPAGFRAPAPIAGSQNAGGGWAVQVGAFASSDQARSAAQTAQSSVGGRVGVTSVQVGRNTLFRARVHGLNQGHAQQACDRLRTRGGCTVLSPDAQG